MTQATSSSVIIIHSLSSCHSPSYLWVFEKLLYASWEHDATSHCSHHIHLATWVWRIEHACLFVFFAVPIPYIPLVVPFAKCTVDERRNQGLHPQRIMIEYTGSVPPSLLWVTSLNPSEHATRRGQFSPPFRLSQIAIPYQNKVVDTRRTCE